MSNPLSMSLAELADWYYTTADLGQDGDEDLPESYWTSDEGVRAVLLRAFGSSDCGDFAVMLHEMTGYPVVNLLGPDRFPVHSFVRTPEGLALDVYGACSELEVARRYGFRGKHPRVVTVDPSNACGHLPSDDWNEEGFDERAQRLAAVIRQLPWAPFNTPEFQALSHRRMEGVDVSVHQAPTARRSLRP